MVLLLHVPITSTVWWLLVLKYVLTGLSYFCLHKSPTQLAMKFNHSTLWDLKCILLNVIINIIILIVINELGKVLAQCKISAQLHALLCTQYMDIENNFENDILSLGLWLGFKIIWGLTINIPASNLVQPYIK